MSVPTICQACGQRIEDPERGEHVCQKCAKEAANVQFENAMKKVMRENDGLLRRLDDSDLTQKLWRIRSAYRRSDPAEQIYFWFCLCVVGIVIFWLVRQIFA